MRPVKTPSNGSDFIVMGGSSQAYSGKPETESLSKIWQKVKNRLSSPERAGGLKDEDEISNPEQEALTEERRANMAKFVGPELLRMVGSAVDVAVFEEPFVHSIGMFAEQRTLNRAVSRPRCVR